jgi:hypothetical protein
MWQTKKSQRRCHARWPGGRKQRPDIRRRRKRPHSEKWPGRTLSVRSSLALVGLSTWDPSYHLVFFSVNMFYKKYKIDQEQLILTVYQ